MEREERRVAWIGFWGAFVGALLAGGLTVLATWITLGAQFEFDRENRSFDRRLALYAEFDCLSLSLMRDFIEAGRAIEVDAMELNKRLSEIGILGSGLVVTAAGKVQLVIARMKAADSDSLRKLLDSDELSKWRVVFREAARAELKVDESWRGH